MSELKNATIQQKPAKYRFENSDVYSKSSDILTYNLYEQEWTTLQEKGLTHLFNDNEADFERQKEQKGLIAYAATN